MVSKDEEPLHVCTHRRPHRVDYCVRCNRLVCIGARWLCTGCVSATRKDGTYYRYDMMTKHRDDVLNYYKENYRKMTNAQMASNLKMSDSAFRKAVERARARGDKRAVKRPTVITSVRAYR